MSSTLATYYGRHAAHLRPTKHVKSVRITPLSPEEIKAMSVVEVKNVKMFGDKDKPTDDGLYSLYMGSIDHKCRYKCKTCGEYPQKDMGHEGHVELGKDWPIIHTNFYDFLLKILSIFCFHCSKLVLAPSSAFGQTMGMAPKQDYADIPHGLSLFFLFC